MSSFPHNSAFIPANKLYRTDRDDASAYEMDDHLQSDPASQSRAAPGETENIIHSTAQEEVPAAMRGTGIARHTLGLILLLVVVVLWTTSNFLGSVSCSPGSTARQC
jgi:hypothetical protein